MPAKKEPTISYTIDGKTYDLTISDQKLPRRERIEIEEYMGMPWSVLVQGGWLESEKLQTFLAYVAMRRRRPTATLDEVLDAEELSVDFSGDAKKRPTQKASATSGSQSS